MELLQETKKKERLEIGTMSLADLFSNNLTVPDFQRPYEWSYKLIDKLFSDIEDHFFNTDGIRNDATDFYLGSVLLNHKKKNYQIIDGQQRLTTFLILDYVLFKNQSILTRDNIKFTFYSHISSKNISAVKNYIHSIKDHYYFTHNSHLRNVFDRIILNIIITKDENDAFQFFDSLNSKGKKLDTINILKSFHLREVNDEKIQLELASEFDETNALIQSSEYKNYNIHSLNHFVVLLWVKHNFWINSKFVPVTKDVIQDFFQKDAVRYFEENNHIKLFPSNTNIKNNKIEINGNNVVYVSDEKQNTDKELFVEFNPLQPVQKGLGFFLSIITMKKYFDSLFISERSVISPITELVKNSFNEHFIHLYYLGILGFYIKFGDSRLLEFAFEMEQILGNKYLYLQSVRPESPTVILRDEFNILQQIYLQIDCEILLKNLKTYKGNIKVESINIESDNLNIDGKKYSLHTSSRSFYIKRALKAYQYSEYEETELSDFLKIEWVNIKSRLYGKTK